MKWVAVVALLVFIAGLGLVIGYWKTSQDRDVKLKEFVITLRLEPEPALKATLYLAFLVGLIVSVALLPLRVLAAVWLVAALGSCWWLLYIGFRGFK